MDLSKTFSYSITLESLFNKIAGLQALQTLKLQVFNFIKKRL